MPKGAEILGRERSGLYRSADPRAAANPRRTEASAQDLWRPSPKAPEHIRTGLQKDEVERQVVQNESDGSHRTAVQARQSGEAPFRTDGKGRLRRVQRRRME